MIKGQAFEKLKELSQERQTLCKKAKVSIHFKKEVQDWIGIVEEIQHDSLFFIVSLGAGKKKLFNIFSVESIDIEEI